MVQVYKILSFNKKWIYNLFEVPDMYDCKGIRQGNGCAHLVNWVISNFSIYINSIHVWLLHIESSKKSHFGKDAIYSA